MARIKYANRELSRKPMVEGKPRLHRLKLVSGFPKSIVAERIFQQFGLGYFLCHEFPRIIETNFPVLPSIRKLIEAMYKYHDRQLPEWRCPTFQGKTYFAPNPLDP